MNVTMKLTLNGLIEALRWKVVEQQAAKDVKPDGRHRAAMESGNPAEANDGK